MYAPAVCPSCRLIFESGLDIHPGWIIQVQDCTAECPRCLSKGFIPNGIYQVFEQAFNVAQSLVHQPSLISAATDLAKAAANGEMEENTVIKRAESISPRVGDVFRSAYAATKDLLIIGSSLAAIYCAFAVYDDRNASQPVSAPMTEVQQKDKPGGGKQDVLRPLPRPVTQSKESVRHDQSKDNANRHSRRRAEALARKDRR